MFMLWFRFFRKYWNSKKLVLSCKKADGYTATAICLNVCPQISRWNLNPKMMWLEVRAFGRWYSHERRAIMNGIRALWGRPQRNLSSLLPCEDRVSKCHRWRTGLSLDAASADTLILKFLASKTGSNKFLRFKPSSWWYFVIVARAD